MRKETYRIYFDGQEDMFFEGHSLSSALSTARNISATYKDVVVKQRSGGRWFTLAEADKGRVIARAKKLKKLLYTGKTA